MPWNGEWSVWDTEEEAEAEEERQNRLHQQRIAHEKAEDARKERNFNLGCVGVLLAPFLLFGFYACAT